MRADTSFAVKVVARYAVILTGVILASRKLGLGWDDVQWLVAALSVGLGFGLQEIFGNLVAGLIMLAERPVRIGDVVTVGDVTGTVARISARATTVTDFDNKEILIPNKSFVTDRVVQLDAVEPDNPVAVEGQPAASHQCCPSGTTDARCGAKQPRCGRRSSADCYIRRIR